MMGKGGVSPAIGERGRIAPQFYYYAGRLGVLGEYTEASPDVARLHELEIDEAAFAGGTDSFADPEAAAAKATGSSAGPNWYLDENLKWMLDYERTRLQGGAAEGADRDDTDAVLLRIALGF